MSEGCHCDAAPRHRHTGGRKVANRCRATKAKKPCTIERFARFPDWLTMTPAAPSPTRWPARLALVVTTAYVGTLLFATHYPQPQDLLGSGAPPDKALHLTAYAVLGLLVGATLALGGRWSSRTGMQAAAGLALFAVLDEATQPLPWFRRAADPRDWLFDCLGIAVGLAIVAVAVWALGRIATSPKRQ